jgi:hypothetical protein
MTVDITTTPAIGPVAYKRGDVVELEPLSYDPDHTRYYIIARHQSMYRYVNLMSGEYRHQESSISKLILEAPPLRTFTTMELG